MNRRQILIGTGAATLAVAGTAFAGWRQMGSMGAYNDAVAAMRSAIKSRPETVELIRLAALAPNGHNTQPWLFRPEADAIHILPDLSRATPVVDPDNHHVFVSLGCAAENLSIAANAAGRPGHVAFDATGEGALSLVFADAPPGDAALLAAITQRQSTRTDYDGKPVSAEDLDRLATSAAMPGVTMVLVTEPAAMARVRDLVLAGNSVQMRDKAFVTELKSWLRFSPREALQTGDGLFSASSGNPALPAWIGPTLFDLAFSESSENDKYARHMNSSAGVAIFVSEVDDREHWVLAGRAAQRFALQATVLGLKTAFVNQPVEVAALRPELATLAGLPGRRPDLVIRFGTGPSLPYAARRPVPSILTP